MNFFNSLIDDVQSVLEAFEKTTYTYNKNNAWLDVGYNQVILQRDTGTELDGTGFDLVTSLPVNDSIIIVGDDLDKIKKNSKFARISVISIDDIEDQQKTYDLIKKIEYTKYHYFPDGYMIRTSSRSHKEVVRVSKESIKKGISFQKVGNLLINKYRENLAVKGVTVIFITEPNIDFRKIEAIAERNNSITETLNHVMNSVNFDCSTCNLKPICDEVEGMKELHFKQGPKTHE